MAPEQAEGVTDARSDLFSAGVILAEMVSPGGIRDFESRKGVWDGVRSEPVQVPDSPWAPVVKKAVAKDPEERFQSAHELTRALEEVAFRVHDETGLEPYPGLSSFDEDDAEYFFGREAEVEAVWQKLQSAQLLGIIGASGSGKSSFIGAGLIPARPEGWSIVRCTPGSAAVDSLRRAVLSEIEDDAEAVKKLASGGDTAIAEAFGGWRQKHAQALLVADQFEELFTQNTDEEQRRCAEILGRIALDADVRVLLSMRDDFLMRCHEREELLPMFSELTGLRPPVGGALRRAVVQPALRCGYRFEDEELADEILAEVEGERGALPLLAFALARLWEKRDRENGLITRQAYRDIGGVGGALARHAEALMERLGPERHGTVREIFRNLVTAQGTRAARDTDELLSVFRDNRDDAAEVLRALVDARLLTSYELRSDDGPGRQRVEVIHESLLKAWPRLVRWQTQDADSARVRDELRQAARTWDEHDRSDDLLWTGSAYREFAVWRERYPGGLTAVEEAFAEAMASLAGRRRRRRRIAVSVVIAVLLAGLAVVGSFWQRSVREARRAEAANLLFQAELEFGEDPSATVAHTIASLELADTPAARRLALEALWQGPTALVVTDDDVAYCRFSADGRWLAYSEWGSGAVRIVTADGNSKVLESVHEVQQVLVLDSPWSDVLLTVNRTMQSGPQHLVLWSAPEGRRLAEFRYEGAAQRRGVGWNENRVLLLVTEDNRASVDALRFDGARERLGTLDFDFSPDEQGSRSIRTAMDSQTGRWLGVVVDNQVMVYEIGEHDLSAPRPLGRHEGSIVDVVFDSEGRYLATANQDGEIRLWDPTGPSPPTIVKGPARLEGPVILLARNGSMFYVDFWEDERDKLWLWSVTGGEPRLLRRFDLGVGAQVLNYVEMDPVGGHLASGFFDRKVRLWRFGAPADAEPLAIGRDEPGQLGVPIFARDGRWLATTATFGLALWPLERPYPSVMRHDVDQMMGVVFAPDGSWLASLGALEAVRIWPLTGDVPAEGRVLFDDDPVCLAVSPGGGRVLVGTQKAEGGDLLISVDGSSRRVLRGFHGQTSAVAFSQDGRLAAGAGGSFDDTEKVIRIWDVESGEELKVLVPEANPYEWTLQFTREDSLLSAGVDGLRKWNLATGGSELLYRGNVNRFAASADGRRVLLVEPQTVGDVFPARTVFLDFENDVVRRLDSHGSRVGRVALDPSARIAATGDADGVIRVGPVTGEEPQLLLGHQARVSSLAFDPLGRWLASGADDGTARLWPMPDLSKPPLHTLPHEELITKLKTLTNLRVVRDEESATGWTLQVGPFPGWETVPTW
jgi:WD40 repeat protein